MKRAIGMIAFASAFTIIDLAWIAIFRWLWGDTGGFVAVAISIAQVAMWLVRHEEWHP
jgi:hypothetical protein